jgi:hypothetical protein
MDARNDPRRPDVPKLTPGSRYRILSMMTRDAPLETEGEFKGYTAIGGMDAICMEVKQRAGGKGGAKPKMMLRLIPTQMVISIDIIDQAKEAEKEKAGPDSRAYM